jgi:hypothetical protein
MYYDHTNFQNVEHRSGTDDRSGAVPASSRVVEVISPIPIRNWAWAHDGDLYDWMDWHSPFPAAGPSE